MIGAALAVLAVAVCLCVFVVVWWLLVKLYLLRSFGAAKLCERRHLPRMERSGCGLAGATSCAICSDCYRRAQSAKLIRFPGELIAALFLSETKSEYTDGVIH
jgi:hypothetical protein